jgi:hypothetical protein
MHDHSAGDKNFFDLIIIVLINVENTDIVPALVLPRIPPVWVKAGCHVSGGNPRDMRRGLERSIAPAPLPNMSSGKERNV